MNTLLLFPEPLTREQFAPFGDVLAFAPDNRHNARAANQGSALRMDYAAKLINARADAKPNLALFRSRARALPFSIELLEKHAHSSQTFLPLQVSRYVVIVAAHNNDGTPQIAAMRAFLAHAGQGVNYHANTWHHPLIVLDSDADFAMLAWENESAGDCTEFQLPHAVSLDLPPQE